MFGSKTEKPQILPYEPIAAGWYDKSYYSGKKSNWAESYNLEYCAPIFRRWASFLIKGFPFVKTILDAGCAFGFLEKFLQEVWEKNALTGRTIEGFDHSRYAIDNAPEGINVQCAGVDDYEFTKKYDLLVTLDMLEHLTEEQALNFLSRSREHINHSVLAYVALDEAHNRGEPSHINLQGRKYWQDLFLRAGWVESPTSKLQLEGVKYDFHFGHNAKQFFIYRSNENVE